ncbi:MAG TPA: PAS domain-containing protein [Polyangia bacterium]|nr:PAS domain-containing protein [Polyangia bacterium]
MDEEEGRDRPYIDHAKILDDLGDPVLVISRSFRVVYMNTAARARYGSFDLDAEAPCCHQILHRSARPCFEVGEPCLLCSVFETGCPARVVHSHAGPNGTFAPEEVVASPLRDPEGRVAFVVTSVRGAADLLESKVVMEHMRDELDLLRGVLLTCAGCKSIRTGEGEWVQIETYLAKHSTAEFSHGICPGCVARLYPDFQNKKPE